MILQEINESVTTKTARMASLVALIEQLCEEWEAPKFTIFEQDGGLDFNPDPAMAQRIRSGIESHKQKMSHQGASKPGMRRPATPEGMAKPKPGQPVLVPGSGGRGYEVKKYREEDLGQHEYWKSVGQSPDGQEAKRRLAVQMQGTLKQAQAGTPLHVRAQKILQALQSGAIDNLLMPAGRTQAATGGIA